MSCSFLPSAVVKSERIPKRDYGFGPGSAPIAAADYKPSARVEGVTLSRFGISDASTHALVVNLDYKAERTETLTAPSPLETFDATTGQWFPANAPRAELRLPGGGGKLVRVMP